MASFERNFLRDTPGLEYEATRPQNIRRNVERVPEFNDQNSPEYAKPGAYSAPSQVKTFVRPNQYQNQFQQSVEDSQNTLAPGKPVDYNSVENQLRRMQADKPITQSADSRELASRMPGRTDYYTRENEIRNAQVGKPDYMRTPGGRLVPSNAREEAAAPLRAQYAAEDARAQQGLTDAYSQAKEAVLERQRQQNAADVAELGQRGGLAQQGLTAAGYAYNTDAMNALQRQSDFAELYGRSPDLAMRVYPEFANRMGVQPGAAATGQAASQAPGAAPAAAEAAAPMGSGRETWAELQKDNSPYAKARRDEIRADLDRLQVSPNLEDFVLEKAGRDLGGSNLKRNLTLARMGNEGKPQGAIFKKNVGIPEVRGLSPDQPTQLQKWYNDHAYLLASMGAANPLTAPFAAGAGLKRYLAGNQPGTNDVIVDTDMGKQVIRGVLDDGAYNRWVGEQQRLQRGQ